MFTTEPSRNAMLDPTLVAASVNRSRFRDRPASKQIVAWMIPVSQGRRVNPTIGMLDMNGGSRSDCAQHKPLAALAAKCVSDGRQASRQRPQPGKAQYRVSGQSLQGVHPSLISRTLRAIEIGVRQCLCDCLRVLLLESARKAPEITGLFGHRYSLIAKLACAICRRPLEPASDFRQLCREVKLEPVRIDPRRCCTLRFALTLPFVLAVVGATPLLPQRRYVPELFSRHRLGGRFDFGVFGVSRQIGPECECTLL